MLHVENKFCHGNAYELSSFSFYQSYVKLADDKVMHQIDMLHVPYHQIALTVLYERPRVFTFVLTFRNLIHHKLVVILQNAAKNTYGRPE